jgi:2-polyprenyl-3-methyl-5-hydroxy-6-metoxy-1,4-benzoquinol methylase
MRGVVRKSSRNSLQFKLCKEYEQSADSANLRKLFINLAPGSQVDKFIASNRAGLLKTLKHRMMTRFTSISDFDANGMIDIYPLHLFTTAQIRLLLQHAELQRIQGKTKCVDYNVSILDVGAGVGAVTDELRGLSNHIVTTEMSPAMFERLQQRGYECWNEDVSSTYVHRLKEGRVFNMVSLLNVMDRTPRPVSLLRAARELLSPKGLLLLATPLPFRPFYFTSNHSSAPAGAGGGNVNSNLNLSSSGRGTQSKYGKYGKPLEIIELPERASWEEQVSVLIQRVLPDNGFKPLAFTRLPYVSGGDFFKEFTALDDVVIVAEKE